MSRVVSGLVLLLLAGPTSVDAKNTYDEYGVSKPHDDKDSFVELRVYTTHGNTVLILYMYTTPINTMLILHLPHPGSPLSKPVLHQLWLLLVLH